MNHHCFAWMRPKLALALVICLGVGSTGCDENGAEYDLSCLEKPNPGALDFPDHDLDGLSDTEELDAHKTNPCAVDTDGDGASDLVEVRGSGTDPRNQMSTIDPGDFALVLPHESEAQTRELRFQTKPKAADIFFLVDSTATMKEEIASVRAGISRISSKILSIMPDSQIGVGHFEDIPHCVTNTSCRTNPTSGFGTESDVPFATLAPIGATMSEIDAALAKAEARTEFRIHKKDTRGGDAPESQIEALFHAATDAGRSYARGDWGGSVVVPDAACPQGDEPRRGKACFRSKALPIVVLISDAPWGDRQSVGGVSFEQAANALKAIHGRFLGISIEENGQRKKSYSDMRNMANATLTLRTDGGPLVYVGNKGTVSDEIIRGIEAIANEVRQDVSTAVRGLPSTVAGDGQGFVGSLATAGTVDGGNSGALTLLGQDEQTYFGLTPGIEVDFKVTFQNQHQPATDRTELYRAEITVLGNKTTILDTRKVYAVVPGKLRKLPVLQ